MAKVMTDESFESATEVQERLCELICAEVQVFERRGQWVVSLPLECSDGDRLVAHLKREKDGWRISDKANTWMRLSCENDLSKLLGGTRGKLYEQVLSESGIREDDGELLVDVRDDELALGLFRMARAMSRVEDLGRWGRGHSNDNPSLSTSTFA